MNWNAIQLLLCLQAIARNTSAQSQEGQIIFNNLFRGSSKTRKGRGGSKPITVQPINEADGGIVNDLQSGLIKINPELWTQEAVDLKLFPLDDDDDSTVYKFRQSPEDQPTPNQFYGKLDLDGDGELDSFVLVNATSMSTKLSVIVGTLRVKGNLYQIRQLPSGKIIVENRGTDDNFDGEIEIDDDMADEWLARPKEFPKETGDELELELPPDRQRRLIVSDRLTMNNSAIHLGPEDYHRQLQGSDDGSQLDIMIVYTRTAMCAAVRHFNDKCVATAANKATIEGIIDLAIREANEALSTSGIQTSLRLVHVHYDDEYDDTAHPWPTVFSHYTGHDDGHLDYIHQLRDQYGADFVSFFVNTRGYCGSAYRPADPREERAFSMVRWDCAIAHHTFAHEVSHNLGCRHDQGNAISNVAPGDYNFGYRHSSPAIQGDRWRTLMAYDCPDVGCQRLLRYSNPLLSTKEGVPFGTEYADNARFIRERLNIYANFRTSVIPKVGPNEDPPGSAQLAPAISDTVVYPRGTRELDTVTKSGSLIGAAGNMFDVVAKKDLKITGFAVTAFAATTVTVEVYKLKNAGTFVGEEYTAGSWTLIGGATIQAKADRPTSLPPGSLSAGVTVRQGTVQAFYVTYRADNNYNRYSRATELGEVYAENDDIQFKVGHTVNYPFQYHPKAPRVFNGKVFYEVLPTQPPTNAPTSPPVATEKKGLSTDLALSDDLESFLTTYVSNNGHSGNLFTIEATADIIIETFDVHTELKEKNMELKIYTKYGEFSRLDDNPSGTWTLIADTTVQGQGEFQLTHVPAKDVQSVAVKADTRQSFYITFTGPHIKYTAALIDPNIIRNNHMSFVASAGAPYPFKHYFPNRVWNGVIYYKVGDDGTADLQGSDTAVETGEDSGSGGGGGTSTVVSSSVAPRSSP